MTLDANLAINFALLGMLAVILVGVARTTKLLTAILLAGVYTLVAATWFVVMDAPDVAFTEAVVGAGVSTVVLLGAVLLTRSNAAQASWRAMILPGAAALGAGALLAYAALDLPSFGDPSSPANAYVGRLYLNDVMSTTGVPNTVTAVLASYRGFDTLGETAVILAAGLGVALMLGFGERALADEAKPPPGAEGRNHVVLSVAAKLMIPLIALYAFYVQFHGDLGPGGGFQAGVIFAIAVILHALVFGLHETMVSLRPGLVRSIASLGVLAYAAVGVVNMVNGGAFLDYDHLFTPELEAMIPAGVLGDPHGAHHWGQHFGIIGVEIGVFLTVAATMVTIFYGFAGRSADAPKADAT